MKHIRFSAIPFLFFGLILISSLPFSACEPEEEDLPEDSTSNTHLRKPNIYLYPTEDIQLEVSLGFPLGGEVTTSIPEYGTGWDIFVEPGGLIDKNYTFLFYESIQPDVWQYEKGWVKNMTELEKFFRKNMSDYGFDGQEIEDYIEYWIPLLKNSPYYAIYPQNNAIISEVVELNFSINPDNILRLYYIIKGYEDIPNLALTEPQIMHFNRDGFFVTEWGVALK